MPRPAPAHRLLGEMLAGHGTMTRAAAEFAEAVRIAPEDGQAQLDLALTLLQAGDRAAAEEHFRQAARSNTPGIAEAANGWWMAANDVEARVVRRTQPLRFAGLYPRGRRNRLLNPWTSPRTLQ
jgi:predicted Zn-dependent protease